MEIARYVTLGLRNKTIALMMGISEHVIKNYLRMIYDKLGLWNRTELALWYTKKNFNPETDC